VPCGVSTSSSSPAFFHLPRLQQRSHAEVVDTGIVADDRETLHAAVDQRLDQVFGDTAQAETTGGEGHVIVQQSIERGLGIGVDFLHGSS